MLDNTVCKYYKYNTTKINLFSAASDGGEDI